MARQTIDNTQKIPKWSIYMERLSATLETREIQTKIT